MIRCKPIASTISASVAAVILIDLTNTVFAGHHQPLKVWISCLYLMGLNVSNNQIAKELDLCTSDVHAMTTLLRTGVVERKPDVTLEGEVRVR